MSNFTAILGHKKKLTKETLDLKDKQIEAAIDRLTLILTEREQARIEAEKALEEKLKVIEEMKVKMQSSGVTVEDLTKPVSKLKSV